MNFYEIIFSPTGGTKKVADALVSGLSDSVILVDLCDNRTNFETLQLCADDICLVAIPAFGGRLPPVAAQRLLRITGGSARAIPVAVYGNREYEDTLIELKDTLDAAGFICVSAVCAIAEHSVVRHVAAGRPDSGDLEELAHFADTIKAKLSAGDLSVPEFPGNRPYKTRMNLGIYPFTGTDCVKCGLCAKRCPVDAIPTSAPNTTDTGLCISCMRCVGICPNGQRAPGAEITAFLAGRLKTEAAGHKPNELYI